MSTLRQIAANRRNAQKSTGPRSVEGKAASRFNALKTGITAKSMVIPGEDPAELESVAAEYHDQFLPATALERFLVDALVAADWQIRRLRRVEAQLWQHQIARAQQSSSDFDAEASLGQVFETSPAFLLLHRRLESAERSYYRALKQLQKIQAEDQGQPDAPELASFSPELDLPMPDFSRAVVTPPAPAVAPAILSPVSQTPCGTEIRGSDRRATAAVASLG